MNPSRRRLVVAVAGVAILAACLGGIAVARAGGGADDEFVAAAPTGGYVMELKKADPTFTLSSIYIERPGEVRILEVRALTSPNVEYLGAAVNVWPSEYRTTPLSVGPGFPSPELKVHHPLEEPVPVAEMNLAPQPGVTSPPPLAIAAGFRIVSGDLGAVNGVRVIYTANGERFVETFRQAVIACVKPRPCDEPEGTDFNTWQNGILTEFGLLREES